MKHLFSAILVVILVISCAPQMQLVTIKSSNSLLDDSTMVFRDSLVKIDYNFYSPNGQLTFRIRNNYTKPIFIDWKNSMFIVSDDKRYSYWNDEASVQVTTQGTNVALIPWRLTSTGLIQGSIRTPERITFLPPNTEITVSRFDISDGSYYNLATGSEIVLEKNTWNNSKKPTKILHKNFDISNSPSHFRNYLTISLKEDFKEPIHYDFGFWISELHEMSAKQLVGDLMFLTTMDSTQMNSKYHPYKKLNRFFLKAK